MTIDIPKDHPRYLSLVARHVLEDGVKAGITTMTGLVAHGRGEAFDYLLGERTQEFASRSIRAAAALMLLANKPVISVNGNSAVLVPEQIVNLAKAASALIEINIFHDVGDRRSKIAAHLRTFGADPLGERPDAVIAGLTSARAKVDSRGILDADVVLVALEDGDRTEALKRGGKKVIAIDLNPLSRTPQMADISIVDNLLRAIPSLTAAVNQLRHNDHSSLERIVDDFDNRRELELAEQAIRKGVPK